MRAVFTKMQGLGNDFLVMDLRDAPAEAPAIRTAAPRLCDRHFGVGADGVLLVLPGERAAARMVVVNADGSEAEMCGNGLRCVVRYLDPPAGEIAIETGAGVLGCRMAGAAVEIDMGAVEVGPEVEAGVSGRLFSLTPVRLGNPHVVYWAKASEDLRVLATRYGPLLERHRRFPDRTNVEFAHPRRDGGIDLVVWERGSGLTLACGTGACATGAAAVASGLAREGAWLPIHLPGGTLEVQPGGHVRMRGPAEEVFRGQVEVERFK